MGETYILLCFRLGARFGESGIESLVVAIRFLPSESTVDPEQASLMQIRLSDSPPGD